MDDWVEEREWQVEICAHHRRKYFILWRADSKSGTGRPTTQAQTHRSMRQISTEMGIHQSSVFCSIHDDLGQKCRAQKLTQVNRAIWVQHAKKLLEMYPEHKVDYAWFTDEKIIHFCFQQWNNYQNRLTKDEVIAKTSTPRFIETRCTTISAVTAY